MNDGATAAAAIRWVGQPVTIVAAVVLLLNDQVLKQAWPGMVTGKLSDLAGLVVAPALAALAAALVAPRAPARWVALSALAATGAGFAWVKLTAYGAGVASAAWSLVAGPSDVLADPTDLMALPALGLAWWAWRRAATKPAPDHALTTRVRVLVALPFTLLAVAATSAPGEPPAITVVDEVDGEVLIGGNVMPMTSDTGVSGWRRLSDDESSGVGVWPERDNADRRQAEACVPSDPRHCYRVHGAGLSERAGPMPRGGRLLGVDVSGDGGRTWRTAWEVSAGRWRFLAGQHELFRPRDDWLLASLDVLVRDVPGGHQVIVANGVEGLLVRDPSGAWRRVAVDVPGRHSDDPGESIGPRPLTSFGAGVGAEAGGAVWVALLGLALGSAVVGWRIRRTRWLSAVLWPVVVLSAVVLSLPGLAAVLFLAAMPLSVVAGFGTLTCVIAAAVAQPDVPRVRALVLGGAAAVTGALFAAPYLGWSVGAPDRYETATMLAWLLAAVGALGVTAISWWAGGAVNACRTTTPPGQSTGSGAPSKSTIE